MRRYDIPRVYLVASTGLGRLSPHMNLGYTASGASSAANAVNSNLIAPPDEINYAGGADAALTLRTTVAFDIIGRRFGRSGRSRTCRPCSAPAGAPNADRTVFQELRLTPGVDLHLLLGSAGVKFNPYANLLVSANVLFPLSNSGLTGKLTYLLGFDYSF